ncbi:MAG TPA: hypothetical protein VLD67_01325 [Vicinamibacterales bacterium]|nr:hypothetical protein [Vicinamibacterales bacterium]
MSYRHRQIGLVAVIGLGLAAGLAAYIALVSLRWPLAVLAIGMTALLVLFSTLTTHVGDRMLHIAFGPGLIHRAIPVREIEDVSVVRTPWYYGWGLRLTPRGWLWRVSGTQGVELRLRNGRRFRVGSDEPEQLAAAIREEQSRL